MANEKRVLMHFTDMQMRVCRAIVDAGGQPFVVDRLL